MSTVSRIPEGVQYETVISAKARIRRWRATFGRDLVYRNGVLDMTRRRIDSTDRPEPERIVLWQTS